MPKINILQGLLDCRRLTLVSDGHGHLDEVIISEAGCAVPHCIPLLELCCVCAWCMRVLHVRVHGCVHIQKNGTGNQPAINCILYNTSAGFLLKLCQFTQVSTQLFITHSAKLGRGTGDLVE